MIHHQSSLSKCLQGKFANP